MSLRSERMPSKNITSWSLKKTTGSMLGRPRSAYSSCAHSRTKREVELRLQVTIEVVGGDEVLQRDGDRFVEAAGFWAGRASWNSGIAGEASCEGCRYYRRCEGGAQCALKARSA